MRVGIMGGTLDPVHNGHIQLAQAALADLKLDGVMLLPAGDPPHKDHTTSKADRLEMVRLAARDVKGIFPCAIEIQRCGTTFTVDTLRELRNNNPDTDWFYIIGADTLDVLDSWKSFDQVAKMCSFAVCGRADEAINRDRMKKLEQEYGASFVPVNFNGPDISSTDIRMRVSRGESIADLVPNSVGRYIMDRGLYLSALARNEILTRLQKNLKPGRFAHTLGVAETAVRLAERYGVVPAQAELAALLHDCAKYMPLNEMRALVIQHIPDTDPLELEAVSVLHAPAGAVVACQEYGVQNPHILSAIRKHTLGDAEMSALDALIYTADFIEPGRENFPGLAQARALAETDLYAAMCLCAELTNRHLETQGRHAHPRSLAMLHHYKKRMKKEEMK